MNKITSNLIVTRIEPCLSFWVDRLGFEKAIEAPGEGGLAFVILRKGSVELMLQSRASVETDVPPMAEGPYRSVLYVEVDDLAEVRSALEGWPPLVPERTTSYGAREIIVRDPEGNVVFFAAHT